MHYSHQILSIKARTKKLHVQVRVTVTHLLFNFQKNCELLSQKNVITPKTVLGMQ